MKKLNLNGPFFTGAAIGIAIGALFLAFCSGCSAPQGEKAAWEAATYTKQVCAEFEGSRALQALSCDSGDAIVTGGCSGSGGAVETSSLTPDGNGWECGIVIADSKAGAGLCNYLQCEKGK